MSFGGHRLVRSGRFSDLDATTFYGASRPLLEFLVRRRVLALPNVTFLEGLDVIEAVSTVQRDRVTGVRVADRSGGQEQVVTADLVVDATGRGSRTPAFLEQLGDDRPVEDELTVRLVYSSQFFPMTPGAIPEKVVNVGCIPGRPRAMGLFGYENDTWMLTLGGTMGYQPPTELGEMLDCAAELVAPHVGIALRLAEPIGEVARHRSHPIAGGATTNSAGFPMGCSRSVTPSAVSIRSTGKDIRVAWARDTRRPDGITRRRRAPAGRGSRR